MASGADIVIIRDLKKRPLGTGLEELRRQAPNTPLTAREKQDGMKLLQRGELSGPANPSDVRLVGRLIKEAIRAGSGSELYLGEA